VPSGCRP